MPKSKSRPPKKNGQGNSVVRIDAMSIRRSKQIFQIPIDKIDKSDWMVENDPIFSSLYEKYLDGKISGFLTRIPLEMIQEGFYVASRNFEYVCDDPPEDVVAQLMSDIRQGVRHPLHLYANPKPNAEIRFLCPDDVAICLAYRRLGIKLIPAIIFSTGGRSLPYSSLEAKVPASATDLGPRVCALLSADKPKKMSSLWGTTLPTDVNEGIVALSSALRTVVARLRLFHVHETGQLHYHHMVFSAVVRMQETLRAIELLTSQNLWYQALALLRVLYEIHLNFFFDWLQPETNYRFLAAAAVLDSSTIAKAKNRMVAELIEKGVAPARASEQANIAWRPVNFASTVAEKARLTKIGILYHKDIYNFLSQISHQDFEVASLHANRFDDAEFLTMDSDVKKTYLRFMDYIVSEFVSCVDGDIGFPP